MDPTRSVPAVLERAGATALFAADEFFAARISNPHTRRAYARVVRRFLAWCEDNGLELARVSPGLAGRFIDELPGDTSTKNQALAGLPPIFSPHSFRVLVVTDLLSQDVPLEDVQVPGRPRQPQDHPDL